MIFIYLTGTAKVNFDDITKSVFFKEYMCLKFKNFTLLMKYFIHIRKNIQI